MPRPLLRSQDAARRLPGCAGQGSVPPQGGAAPRQPRMHPVSRWRRRPPADAAAPAKRPVSGATMSKAAPQASAGGSSHLAPAGAMFGPAGPAGTGRRESLGNRTIEGVVTEGTRTVRTIARGAIGNDRPIDIVTEQWYSPEFARGSAAPHGGPTNGRDVVSGDRVATRRTGCGAVRGAGRLPTERRALPAPYRSLKPSLQRGSPLTRATRGSGTTEGGAGCHRTERH